MPQAISWSSGEAYEAYVGRWSRLVARDFIAWLSPHPRSRWLDVGCGTGALSRSILDDADPETVRGVDPSEAYVDHTTRTVDDARAKFSVGDGQRTGQVDDSFDYVVSGLVLNFVPSPAEALTEMARVAAPHGTIAAYVWDYAEGMQLMRLFWDAAAELDPRSRDLDEGKRFTICRPAPLKSLWDGAGLSDVVVEPIVIPTIFKSFDDYWTPFLGGQGPAPGYVMSLPEEARNRLRDLLKVKLPVEPDGTIALTARAWAVSGVV